MTTFTQFFFKEFLFNLFFVFRKFSFYLWYLNIFLIRIFLSFLLLLDIFSFPNCKLCKNLFVGHTSFLLLFTIYTTTSTSTEQQYMHTQFSCTLFFSLKLSLCFMPPLWYCCCCLFSISHLFCYGKDEDDGDVNDENGNVVGQTQQSSNETGVFFS